MTYCLITIKMTIINITIKEIDHAKILYCSLTKPIAKPTKVRIITSKLEASY